MPAPTDLSKLTVLVDPFPGVEEVGPAAGLKYALGVSAKLRKMHTPGADPGLTEFTDRPRALYAAAAVFKYGGCHSLVLYRQRPEAGCWEPVAFLAPSVPPLADGWTSPTLAAVTPQS